MNFTRCSYLIIREIDRIINESIIINEKFKDYRNESYK